MSRVVRFGCVQETTGAACGCAPCEISLKVSATLLPKSVSSVNLKPAMRTTKNTKEHERRKFGSVLISSSSVEGENENEDEDDPAKLESVSSSSKTPPQ